MMIIPNTIMGINATPSPSPPPCPSPPNLTTTTATTTSSSDPCSFPSSNPNKRKRRPAGTPDPDAEVVSLSPKTLLESDRYVCEICNQGFQRDQNLQMHRRRHKVPWKLLKRERGSGDPASTARKRVYVCPEPSCLHHDPGHALGDLVGIKKHFRRKHSDRRQWVCERCGKGYAVQSDYKAHLKTCGTRGHSCDCGRVFSRVESFIEHQDACNMGHLKTSSNNNNDSPQKLKPQCLSRTTASSPRPSSDTNNNTTITKSPKNWWPPLPPLSIQPIALPKPNNIFKNLAVEKTPVTHPTTTTDDFHNLDLQLSSSSPSPGANIPTPTKKGERFFPPRSTRLRLSVGTCDTGDGEGAEKPSSTRDEQPLLLEASVEKAYADEARRQARRQIEMAEKELADAKRMRKQAQAELEKARVIKERARDQIKNVVLEITCSACKQRIQGKELAVVVASLAQEENSLVLTYISSAITESEVVDHRNEV